MNAAENKKITYLIRPVADKYGVKKVILFGSRARGDHDDASDYDFLISRGRIETALQYLSFVDELEKSLGAHVDVVTDTSSDKDFIGAAIREGILLYES